MKSILKQGRIRVFLAFAIALLVVSGLTLFRGASANVTDLFYLKTCTSSSAFNPTCDKAFDGNDLTYWFGTNCGSNCMVTVDLGSRQSVGLIDWFQNRSANNNNAGSITGYSLSVSNDCVTYWGVNTSTLAANEGVNQYSMPGGSWRCYRFTVNTVMSAGGGPYTNQYYMKGWTGNGPPSNPDNVFLGKLASHAGLVNDNDEVSHEGTNSTNTKYWVDMGVPTSIGRVRLLQRWPAAYATQIELSASSDGNSWSVIENKIGISGPGWVEFNNIVATSRFWGVRYLSVVPGAQDWRPSSLEGYIGTGGPTATPTPANGATQTAIAQVTHTANANATQTAGTNATQTAGTNATQTAAAIATATACPSCNTPTALPTHTAASTAIVGGGGTCGGPGQPPCNVVAASPFPVYAVSPIPVYAPSPLPVFWLTPMPITGTVNVTGSVNVTGHVLIDNWPTPFPTALPTNTVFAIQQIATAQAASTSGPASVPGSATGETGLISLAPGAQYDVLRWTVHDFGCPIDIGVFNTKFCITYREITTINFMGFYFPMWLFPAILACFGIKFLISR